MKAPCNVKVYIINLQEARKTSSRTVMREKNDTPPPNNRVNVTQSKLILTCLYFWDFTISLLFSSLCYLCFQMKPDYVYTESKIKIEVTYKLQAFQFRAPGVFHPPLSTLQFGNASCCLNKCWPRSSGEWNCSQKWNAGEISEVRPTVKAQNTWFFLWENLRSSSQLLVPVSLQSDVTSVALSTNM